MDEQAVGQVGSPNKPWSSTGREELANAVRRLTSLTVTSVATSELLADVARRARLLADELDQFVPEDGPEPISRFSDEASPPKVQTPGGGHAVRRRHRQVQPDRVADRNRAATAKAIVTPNSPHPMKAPQAVCTERRSPGHSTSS